MRVLLTALILLPVALLAGGFRPSAKESEVAEYEFEYRVAIGEEIKGSVSLWIPYPAENGAQKVREARVKSPWPWRLTTDKTFGNRIVYVEGTGPLAGEIVLTFVIERRPFRGIPPSAVAAGTPLDPARHLGGDRLIPLQGPIRSLAIEQGKGQPTAARKARAFYDYVYRTMTYKKEGRGWGRGDAVWACHARYGNCTDFHSLFIGMARSAGVPARLVFGFPIPADRGDGEIPGYHCWAEYYDPERGWLGVDASEAWKARRPDAYFGILPNDRIEFTVGRDLVLEPPQRGEALNYFIYPYAERDGEPLSRLTSQFRFRRLRRDPSAS